MTVAATVFVVEDDARFRDALVLTLESAALPVHAFAAAQAFLDFWRPEMPGCLVSDVRMTGMSGLELQRHLAERGLRIPIVFITGHGDVQLSVTALKNGAVDFLEKPFSAEALLGSVREALAADTVARQNDTERTSTRARYERLSEREARVMSMVIANRSSKEIARELDLSPRTVEHHREHVMRKMEARTLADLLMMGLLCGVQKLSLRSLRQPSEQAPQAFDDTAG